MELHGAPDNSTSEPRGRRNETTPNRADEYGARRVVHREGGSQGGIPDCPRHSHTRSAQTEEKITEDDGIATHAARRQQPR
eukprot:3539269-Pyramimonas_sp.AAC.1